MAEREQRFEVAQPVALQLGQKSVLVDTAAVVPDCRRGPGSPLLLLQPTPTELLLRTPLKERWVSAAS
jgi:hypothetical protein